MNSDSVQVDADTPVVELRSLTKTFGDFVAVDSLEFDLRPGQLLALLGPSGCGKTTTLRMIAGLENPTSGEVRIAGKLFANGSMSVPPDKRGLGMVFQSYALWPHLSVGENVAYGLKRAGEQPSVIKQRVQEFLGLVGMLEYEHRSITNLSGGQQQRVAVARALATRPKLLLLDEPLSNLDAVLRDAMRFEIRTIQQEHNISAIYVTHSQEEALGLADVVGVINAGRLEQLGTPHDIYLNPRTQFVANFIGLANVVRGELTGLEGHRAWVTLKNGMRLQCSIGAVATDEITVGDTVSVSIRPESIRIALPPDEPVEDEQMLTGRVVSSTFSGNLIDYFVEVERLGQLRVQTFAPSRARSGDTVRLMARPRSCVLLTD